MFCKKLNYWLIDMLQEVGCVIPDKEYLYGFYKGHNIRITSNGCFEIDDGDMDRWANSYGDSFQIVFFKSNKFKRDFDNLITNQVIMEKSRDITALDSQKSVEDYKIYTSKNRDRAGGHLFKTYYGHMDSNYNGGSFRKRLNKKKVRACNNLDTKEALSDYYVLTDNKEPVKQEFEGSYATDGFYTENDIISRKLIEALLNPL